MDGILVFTFKAPPFTPENPLGSEAILLLVVDVDRSSIDSNVRFPALVFCGKNYVFLLIVFLFFPGIQVVISFPKRAVLFNQDIVVEICFFKQMLNQLHPRIQVQVTVVN